MSKLVRRILLGISAMMVVAALALSTPADAAKTGQSTVEKSEEESLLYVTDYSVTNETIIPGKEFTLKMTLKNFSSKVAANDIIVMIDNPDGVVPEYGSVSVEYIDTLAPKATKTLKFNYNADSEIEASELNYIVYTSSDSYNTSTPVRIAVGREGDVVVEEFTAPEKYEVGKTDYISALIENVSGKEVNNVVMVAKCDDAEVASATIGTMPIGVSKTQYVSVTFDEPGQHSYEVLLRYTDGEGVNKEFSIGSGMLTVSESNASGDAAVKPADTSTEQTMQNTFGASNIVIMCTIGVLMIAVCCVILILLYRRK